MQIASRSSTCDCSIGSTCTGVSVTIVDVVIVIVAVGLLTDDGRPNDDEWGTKALALFRA